MAESLPRQATLLPAQPAQLVLGDRHIAVEDWPLAHSVEEGRSSMEVRQTCDDLLVIEPKKRTGISLFFQAALVFLGGVIPGAAAAAFQVPWQLSILVGVVVIAGLLFLLHVKLSRLRWFRFDRKTGQMVLERRVGFRKRLRVEQARPLNSIQAVQMLFNGRHSVTEQIGEGERQTSSYREFFGYELNLVLDDPKVPRLNLLSLTDWQWVRETGQSIGNFLGIPVIDKLYHGN
jgi:hypothetical protein